MRLIFMGIFRKLFTPETRCKHDGFLQAIPGEIRPQNYTKLTRNLHETYKTCTKLTKVCKSMQNL